MTRNRYLKYFQAFFSIVVFVILAVITFFAILSAQGKTFDPQTGVKNLGIIRLNIYPQNLSVRAFIDDKEVSLNNNRIEGVDVGVRNLKIQKDGFTTWEKSVIVEDSVVKDVNVQLFPIQLKAEKLFNDDIEKVFYSNDSTYAYFIDTNGINLTKGIYRLKLQKSLIDFSNQKPELVYDFKDKVLSTLSDDYEIYPSWDNTRFIIKDKNEYYLLENDNSTKVQNFEILLNFLPTKVVWFNGSQSILAENNNILVEYNISSGQTILINYKDSKDNFIYGLASNILYIYKNNEIVKYSSGNFSKIAFLNLDKPIIKIVSAKNDSSLFVAESSDNKIYVVDTDKNFVNSINSPLEPILFSDSNKSLLLKDKEDYYVLTLEENLAGTGYNSKLIKSNTDNTNLVSIYFSTVSDGLIYVYQNKDLNSVYISDYDGQNKTQLLKDITLTSDYILITKNNVALFALIKSEETNSSQFYKFSL